MDILDRLVQRVADHPLFLAALLTAYARSENLDDTGLQAALGCDATTLRDLRLCRPPRPDHFRLDVEQLAGHFRLDVAKLGAVLRRGQLLRQAAGAAGDTGLLAAREPEPPAGEDAP
jgi:hypothetical protein